jgi:hypothetical protein
VVPVNQQEYCELFSENKAWYIVVLTLRIYRGGPLDTSICPAEADARKVATCRLLNEFPGEVNKEDLSDVTCIYQTADSNMRKIIELISFCAFDP